ncbi:MAG: AMP-binding protein [Acidobacteria bacterium]|nr:AMP-binding protein [Acidobacteriota bacterium]
MPTTPRQIDLAQLEEQMLQIVRELLTELGSVRAAESVTLNSSLERDLGLGSLEMVELLVRTESHFNIRLPDRVAEEADTPGAWVRAIAGGEEEAPAASQRYTIKQPARVAPPPPESARTLIEVLRKHAEVDPDRVQAHVLEGNSGEDISYGKLLATASNVAAGLVSAGLRQNETVAIMLPTSPQFFYAFFGVMLAGGIAVPIYPPARPDKIEEYVRRQVGILRNAEVRFLISFEAVRRVSELLRLNLPSILGVTTVEDLAGSGARLQPGAIEAAEAAFIQYTSGSTGEPKGVVLTQSNLLANIRGIGWAVNVQPADIVVSWLPLYHDMGLIGSWLYSVYYALPITILSPLAFLSRPEKWLWALHDSRGTLCPAPNFSYELCARKIPDSAIEGLDLSAWRVAINAGEAVLPGTLERFEKRFAPYGFRAESFVPCYGLAESSVALAFPPINRRPVIDRIRRDVFEAEGKSVPSAPDDSSALRFVANGRALPGHEIKVVDEEGHPLEERVQGRVLFRGPSKTAGYFRNPKATAAVTTEDGWMDSGDLGYWAGGEIHITGRAKDLIIKSGRNIVPQEVELAAAEVPEVRRGCVAAFGTRDPDLGTELLVVVAETRVANKEDLDRIEAEIVERVGLAVGMPPDRVELVAPQSIPKTSSGKIRRNETRLLYERGTLELNRRPPWVQILRLWWENLGAWITLGLRRAGRWLHRKYSQALLSVVAASGGVLARAVPGQNATGVIVRLFAKALLRLLAHKVSLDESGRIKPGQPAVLMANRAGTVDPLVLAAMLPMPARFSDLGALDSLPGVVAFLLRPIVLPKLTDISMPPGGTLRQRIRKGLEDGHSIMVLSEGPPTVPAHLSRFRLDALDAAVQTSSPIYPLGVRGTSHILSRGRRMPGQGEARITVGESVAPQTDDTRELVVLRERVREAIAKLCT